MNPIPQDHSNYRVSIKALIHDEQGRRLMVKEGTDFWDIPGGGIDHGETIEQALRREVREEIDVEVAWFDPRPVFVWPLFVADKSRYALWLVYNVKITGTPRRTDHTAAVEYWDLQKLTPSDMGAYFRPAFEEFVRYQP